MCFSQPKLPQVAEPAAAPQAPNSDSTATRDAMQQAGDAQRKAARAKRGRNSTLLTGPQGVQQQPEVQRKTLLGQ